MANTKDADIFNNNDQYVQVELNHYSPLILKAKDAAVLMPLLFNAELLSSSPYDKDIVIDPSGTVKVSTRNISRKQYRKAKMVSLLSPTEKTSEDTIDND